MRYQDLAEMPCSIDRLRDWGDAHVRLVCDECEDELSAKDVAPESGPGMSAAADEVVSASSN